MAGRPRNIEEDELISRATEVFWSKGYYNASAKDLMEAMDIGQGSFYNFFKGGKKELYQKSLRKFWKQAKNSFRVGVSNAENPVAFIRTFFYATIERPYRELQKGCFAGNTLVEASFVDEDLKLLAKQLLSELEMEFEDALLKAQKNNFLSSNKSPKILAKHLINLWNGINLSVRMGHKKNDLKVLIDTNLQVL